MPGRLHFTAQRVLRTIDNRDAIQLQLTARGNPKSDKIQDILSWMDLGHEWIVRGLQNYMIGTAATIPYDYIPAVVIPVSEQEQPLANLRIEFSVPPITSEYGKFANHFSKLEGNHFTPTDPLVLVALMLHSPTRKLPRFLFRVTLPRTRPANVSDHNLAQFDSEQRDFRRWPMV
jgi:hypothetical protein